VLSRADRDDKYGGTFYKEIDIKSKQVADHNKQAMECDPWGRLEFIIHSSNDWAHLKCHNAITAIHKWVGKHGFRVRYSNVNEVQFLLFIAHLSANHVK